MVVVLSLVAAALYALGTVLQQREAAKASTEDAAKASFLLTLARKPQWIAGIVADGLGFACQAVALTMGRIVVVQPLMAASVVFALPIKAKLEKQKVSRRQMVGALAVAGGLGAFLVAGDPSGGRDAPTPHAWIIAGVAIAVVCAGLVLGARGRSPEVRAAMLGSTTGILFGATAALTKGLGEIVSDENIWSVFTSWQLYALLVVGYAGTAINQASLQTGALGAAIATQTALNPITSIALGVFAFDESLHGSPLGVIGVTLSLAVMIGGLFYLANAERQESEKVELPGT